MQTYGGWIRLENDTGWMLTKDASLGPLLRCKEILNEHSFQQGEQTHTASMTQPQQGRTDGSAAMRALDEAVAGNNVGALRAALGRAHAAGLGKMETHSAEIALAGLIAQEARLDALRRGFRHRIEQAKGDERKLRECVDDCAKEGLHEETILAQRLLEEVLANKSKKQQQHAEVLDRLAVAAASGDRAEIKAARDAAKKAGVEMKEIARIFSLNTINSGEQGTQSEKITLAPVEGTQFSIESESREPTGLAQHSEQIEALELPETSEHAPVVAIKMAPVELTVPANTTEEPGSSMATIGMNTAPVGSSSIESWVCSECEFLNSTLRMVCEACDEPRQVSQSPVAVETDRYVNVDGRWVGADSGEWMATITNGDTVQWADGPAVAIKWLSQASFSCEMSAEGVTETFAAELDAEGRLVWCDGDIWIRSGARTED